ncbi:MAG: type II secretion system F family protein [Actinomycetota bacterium]|nr:type II secretion system F family protein [Actinomycetota bacterium]
MAGGVILIGASLAILVYLAADRLCPPSSHTVAVMQALRSEWKRYYGWTYLERPTAAGRASPAIRLGAYLADWLRIRALFISKLERAGVTISPDRFIFWHLTGTIIAGAAGYLLGGAVLAVVAVAIGAATPFAVLPVMAQRRCARIEEQLSDTLQLIGSLLRAGHGFPQALAAVTKETEPPISLALRKVLAQVNLGGTIEEGLDKMVDEVGSIALGWAVTAIKIQREVGGNLSEILDILSLSIRERGELNRQVKALTAEGRLSAYILLVMPFVLAVMLYMTNPTYMALLWETTIGLVLLGVAVVLMTVGSVWLWRLVKVEV